MRLFSKILYLERRVCGSADQRSIARDARMRDERDVDIVVLVCSGVEELDLSSTTLYYGCQAESTMNERPRLTMFGKGAARDLAGNGNCLRWRSSNERPRRNEVWFILRTRKETEPTHLRQEYQTTRPFLQSSTASWHEPLPTHRPKTPRQ